MLTNLSSLLRAKHNRVLDAASPNYSTSTEWCAAAADVHLASACNCHANPALPVRILGVLQF